MVDGRPRHNILDNLLADKKAKPMIVVMPSGWTPSGGQVMTSDATKDPFNDEMMKDIIPFIQATYRTMATPENRALSGLSMGGIQTLNTGLHNLGTFRYVAVMSSGWIYGGRPRLLLYGGSRKIPTYNTALKLFWWGWGETDIARANGLAVIEKFKGQGVKIETMETPGGHEWANWRLYLTRSRRSCFGDEWSMCRESESTSLRRAVRHGDERIGGVGRDWSVPAAASQTQPLQNWAGNYRVRDQPHHVGDVARADPGICQKACALQGAGYPALLQRDCRQRRPFLSLREMKAVVSLDRATRTVTVESGMSYGQLCPSLDRDGFALHNLASLPHISIAGACATGTHGSGVNNGNLSTAVSAFEIVTAGGDVLSIARSRDLRTFQAAVVDLGALGVVTRVTLDVQPAFTMRQDVYLDLPMAQVREHFEDIAAAGYSVSLFTDWQRGRMTKSG